MFFDPVDAETLRMEKIMSFERPYLVRPWMSDNNPWLGSSSNSSADEMYMTPPPYFRPLPPVFPNAEMYNNDHVPPSMFPQNPGNTSDYDYPSSMDSFELGGMWFIPDGEKDQRYYEFEVPPPQRTVLPIPSADTLNFYLERYQRCNPNLAGNYGFIKNSNTFLTVSVYSLDKE